MKKILLFVLALALVLSMSVCFAEEAAVTDAANEGIMLISENPADAEAISETSVKEDGEITVKIDGKEVVFPDQKPILKNDRTMVPMRAIFEALGADVLWDNDTNTAMAKKGDVYILIQIGNTKLIKNNENVELDVPAMLLNDRTLVPVRAISEALECKVEWVEETLEVVISTDVAKEEVPADETVEEIVETETEEALEEDAETEEVTDEK